MRFCFYSGYRDLKGGYTTLLLTLIKELHHQKKEVVLINFSRGLIADELKKEKVEINIIDIDSLNWHNIHRQISHTDIFILTKFEEIYRHLLKINPRVVYFDINDFICQISDYKFGIKFPSLGKKLVNQLLAKRSLFFMDDTGVFNLKQTFSIDAKNPVFLPIPVTVPPENTYQKRHKFPGDILHLTYIGRSVNWKMMPLVKILADCVKSSVQKKIKITIVVDSISEFRRFINVDEYIQGSKLNIILVENMLPSSINEFLLNNSDLHFAMGTAALDAAKLGIPTVLVDYSTAVFPSDYQYRWLFETVDFNLGRNLDKLPVSKGFSMNELLTMLSCDKDELMHFSELSYKYVLHKHSVDKIVTRLISICEESDFRINDAKKLVPFYFNAHTSIKKIVRLLLKQKKQ